ncbi:MAG: porin family protein [Bacteroidia bacterium]
MALILKAQDPNERGNLRNYYNQPLHFGFALSFSKTNFVIRTEKNFEQFDSLKSIISYAKPGFNIGFLAELRLQKYLTLRFLPNIAFAGRSVEYYFQGVNDTITRVKNIESAFLNFPVDIKLRSKRVNNVGAYLLAGGGYALDLQSKRKVDNTGVILSEQLLKIRRDDFFYEAGAGAEFYLEYFKFAIEGKVSMGINNLIIKDNTIFSNPIDKLRSKVFLISITFEG